LQVKGGVQWIPIPKLRLGFSLATPSYLFMVAERLGAFTDLSQTEELLVIGDRQIDFFGGNLGVLFTNKDTKSHTPETSADDDKLLLAFAIGIRYSHGRGNLLGLVFPPNYDPDAIQTRPVDTKVNDVDINFGVKVFF
jgi:hypothetical protein